MASPGWCSSSAAAPFPKKSYDVFVSYRAEDTRRNFTGHLYAALCRNQIQTFKDDRTIEKGEEFWPTLVHAIENSHLCIVVFSKNYAFSTWCLRELTHILECKKEKQVIPVFYQIDPSNVRKQTGSYEEAFRKHKKNPTIDEETVHKWTASLEKAANLSGFDSESKEYRDEFKLTEKIVKDVLQTLEHRYLPNELGGLVGIDEDIAYIESLLKEVKMIGIWGMGGIGKTTIAQALHAKIFPQYDSSCFLENIREESDKHGLSSLHDKLISHLSEQAIYNRRKVVTPLIMNQLKRMKLLIVLDDVNDLDQLDYLIAKYDYLGSNSRVIVTTRDKQILISFGIKGIYEVKRLNIEDSFELFSKNAFDKNHPEIGFEELTKTVVDYVGGIPLALKVLGSVLHSKGKEVWDSALRRLGKYPNMKIQNVLRLSYDGLGHMEKEIFLDIAYFFKGMKKEWVRTILDACGFNGDFGIETLKDRALITTDGTWIQMHDLICEMGRNIVREEFPKEPGKHSRLLDPEEVYDVLNYNKGTHLVEGIILDISKVKDLYLSDDTFTKMFNLRFLKIYNGIESLGKVHIPLGLKSISHKLRYFQWNACPLPCLPSGFCAEKLVELHMPNSSVKKLWDGMQNLIYLKGIDLHGSKKLMELPDFSNATNLEWINLSYCTNLCHIHPSLLCLQMLVNLDLSYCRKLRSLQSKIHLRSLYYVSLEGCSNLKVFSLSSEKIKQLDFRNAAVELLLSSVGSCRNLERLYFRDTLKKLPNELSNLKCLKDLGIYNCSQLDTWNLHVILDGLCSLELLELSNCFNLRQLPCSLGLLSLLKRLVLDGSSVERLPTSINHLPELKMLSLRNCRRLGSLPKLPPSIELLNAINCTSLEKIATSMESEFGSSCTMNFINCVKLNEESINNLEAYIDFRIKQVAASKLMYYSGSQFCFPGNKIPKCFICGTRQRCITIALPSYSNLLGFAFCVVISNDRMPPNSDAYTSRIDCECYFEGRKVGVCQSNYWLEPFDFGDPHNMRIISDHVCLWYYYNSSGAILKAIQEIRANGQPTNLNPVVSFQFSVLAVSCVSGSKLNLNNAIKMCGVWPIYASEEMEVSLGYKTNKCDLMERPAKKLKPSLHTKGDLELGTKSYRYEDIDKSEASTRGMAVGGSGFHHEMHDFTKINLLNRGDELQPPIDQLKELKEFFFHPLQLAFSRRMQHRTSTQMNSTSFSNGFNKLDKRIQDSGEYQTDALEFQNSMDEMELDLDLGQTLDVKSMKESDRDNKLDKTIQDYRVLSADGSEPIHSLNETRLDLGHKSKRCDNEQLFTDNVRKDDFLGQNLNGFSESIKGISDQYQNFIDQTELKNDFKVSSLQTVDPIGLELDLNTEASTYLDIKEIEVGGSCHENQQLHFQTKEFFSQPHTTQIKQNDGEDLGETFSCGCFIGFLWKRLRRSIINTLGADFQQ